MKSSVMTVSAFAPATCANVAVGFDSLGFAFSDIGDVVTLTKRKDRHIIIESIDFDETLPTVSSQNTASIVCDAVCKALNLPFGFSIHIKKGIPLSSGMGGSAASAVAALVAVNEFLEKKLNIQELIDFALLGEKIASGCRHADNITPCLLGGLTLIHSQQPFNIVQLPIPAIHCVLVHPHVHIATRDARAILKPSLTLKEHVQQSAHLATFIAALYQNDLALLKTAFHDDVIEPQRATLFPCFEKVKKAALDMNALGMSFSGSGPSLFAWADSVQHAKQIRHAMVSVLESSGIKSSAWIAPINPSGAHVCAIGEQ